MPDADKAITRNGRTGGAMLGHRPFAKVSCGAMTRDTVSMLVMETIATVATRVAFSAASSAGVNARQKL